MKFTVKPALLTKQKLKTAIDLRLRKKPSPGRGEVAAQREEDKEATILFWGVEK